MEISQEIKDVFMANAEENEEVIREVAKIIRTQLLTFGWDGCDFFTYGFEDGTKADCEIWMEDDGCVYVTAYRQYVDALGEDATDWSCFHQCGLIDCEPSVAYPVEVWES
jgi:hypothetical protein